MKYVLSAAILASSLAGSAQAQSFSLGVGYSDFSGTNSQDTAVITAEYHSGSIWDKGNFSASWGGVAALHDTGDAFLGAGLVGTFQLKNNWFVETSVMPGAFFENEPGNDLGSTFEIRSLLAVGRTLNNGNAVSLAVTHKSNASTAETNPGVNSVLLRWHKPL